MTQELSVSEIGPQMHFIRGQRVMLDNTLADFYRVETGALKRAVRRNIARFPTDFMFELTEEEGKPLICQIGTSEPVSGEHHGGNRYTPFAFTESGVAMLSSVLKSERAIRVNIVIMRAFVQLRETVKTATEATKRMDRLEEGLERLEGKLTQLITPVLSNSEPSSQFTKTSAFSRTTERRANIKFEGIQNAVTQHFGLTRHELQSAGRELSVVVPRQIAMFLIRKHTGASFREIGKCFGGRDHTTALHAFRKIEDAVERDDAIKEVVQAVERFL